MSAHSKTLRALDTAVPQKLSLFTTCSTEQSWVSFRGDGHAFPSFSGLRVTVNVLSFCPIRRLGDELMLVQLLHVFHVPSQSTGPSPVGVPTCLTDQQIPGIFHFRFPFAHAPSPASECPCQHVPSEKLAAVQSPTHLLLHSSVSSSISFCDSCGCCGCSVCRCGCSGCRCGCGGCCFPPLGASSDVATQQVPFVPNLS